MKKITGIAVVLGALLALTAFAGCGSSTDNPTGKSESETGTTQIANPLVEVNGIADFTAQLGFAIDAPEGASKITYTVIDSGIAQVNFMLDKRSYTYRASKTQTDISGVYETFDAPVYIMVDTIDELGGFQLTVQTIGGGDDGALALWSRGGINCSLYTADKVDADTMSMVSLLLAAQQQ